MRYLFLSLLLLTAISGCTRSLTADTLLQPALPDYGCSLYEQQPTFRGGQEGLYRYLAVNVRYPDEAKAKQLSGKVFTSFTIDALGAVSDVRLLKGIGGGCDEEAVRVIAQMPDWVPAKYDGKPIRVKYNLPVYFSEEAQAIRTLVRKWLLAAERSPIKRTKRPTPPLQIDGPLATLYAYRSDKGEPLWLLDGRELTPEARAALDPATIKTLTVIRWSEATEPYGERGWAGIVQLESW